MGFSCGIIGLPNAGKSTLFGALSGAHAQIAEYPFCTIEPNKGVVSVPDERLRRIAELLEKKNPIPTTIEFIDVAGLVKGASKGEGLGNTFLGHIRNVSAIIHAVRCFTDDNVSHVMGSADPLRDIETVNTELALADMEVLTRARHKLSKPAQGDDKETKKRISLIEKLLDCLNAGNPIISLALHEDEKTIAAEYGLVTDKPVLYLCNIGEDGKTDALEQVRAFALAHGAGAIAVSGKLEEEISELPPAEKKAYMKEMGLHESGLEKLIQAAYKLLGLITYYTCVTQVQAWTLARGTPAVKAAGIIHTDFERGFIRAEVIKFDDLVKHGSEHAVKQHGLLAVHGKEYIIEDGDVVRYLFNV